MNMNAAQEWYDEYLKAATLARSSSSFNDFASKMSSLDTQNKGTPMSFRPFNAGDTNLNRANMGFGGKVGQFSGGNLFKPEPLTPEQASALTFEPANPLYKSGEDRFYKSGNNYYYKNDGKYYVRYTPSELSTLTPAQIDASFGFGGLRNPQGLLWLNGARTAEGNEQWQPETFNLNAPLSELYDFYKGLSDADFEKLSSNFLSNMQRNVKERAGVSGGLFGMIMRAAPGLMLGGLASGMLPGLGDSLFGGAGAATRAASILSGQISAPQFLASAAAGNTVAGLTGGSLFTALRGIMSDPLRAAGIGTQLLGLLQKQPQLPNPSASSFTPKATALLSRNDLELQESAKKIAQAERERLGRGSTILTSGRGIDTTLGGVSRPAGRQAELLG